MNKLKVPNLFLMERRRRYEFIFACHPVQHSFQLFSVEHLVTLAIIVIIGTVIFVSKAAAKKRFVFVLLSLVLIASETAYQAWEIGCHQWSVETSLPLQLSDIVVLLAAVMLITKSRFLFILCTSQESAALFKR